ncbi:MAG: nitroreductase family deazaflavin-dependent oxidoreductase [Ilumatobacteraceae bacterium]|nr:nitroreductase family deazaflavin-dependent oxidoreductase [Ilumatobacteraceae bacterium]
MLLTAPVREGTTLVVVASRGGDDRPPSWFLNLQDNPEVGVRLQGGPGQRMRARVTTPEERTRLWPRVIADHNNYAGYQTKTTHVISLVLLERHA